MFSYHNEIMVIAKYVHKYQNEAETCTKEKDDVLTLKNLTPWLSFFQSYNYHVSLIS